MTALTLVTHGEVVTCACGCGQPTLPAIRTDARIGHVKGVPKRFVHGHHLRKSPVDYLIEDRGHDTPCWVWQGALNRTAYGVVSGPKGTERLAHRLAYLKHVGPIPAGMQIDHLCRVRACVNPDHLRLATNAQNAQNCGPRTGRFRGASFDRTKGRWHAQAMVNRRQYHLGYFDTEEEAAQAAAAFRAERMPFSIDARNAA
jgi:hypothetical protein